MTSVHLVTEDRTGGGLAAVIRAEVEFQRRRSGKPHLLFSRRPGTVNGNAELLKQCEKYDLFRFKYSPRYDHVVYVIDACNAWHLPQLGAEAPRPPYRQSLPPFISTVRNKMAALARGPRSNQQWKDICSGFHAHVLVWERESIILSAAHELELGDAVLDVYDERQAAEAIGARFRSLGRRRKYDKAVDGPEFLQTIADSEHLRTLVLDANPSLREIVEGLISLP